MNSSEVYGLYAGVLVLGAGALAAIWHGVIVVTFSFGVKVVPPWNRKAPAPRKAASTDSAAPAAGTGSPAGAAVPGIREAA